MPNFIQYLDSVLTLDVIAQCKARNIPIMVNHDCFFSILEHDLDLLVFYNLAFFRLQIIILLNILLKLIIVGLILLLWIYFILFLILHEVLLIYIFCLKIFVFLFLNAGLSFFYFFATPCRGAFTFFALLLLCFILHSKTIIYFKINLI